MQTILVENSNLSQLFRIFVLHVTFSLQRYFSGSEGYTKHQYTFWHGKHAGFFEGSEDYDRKSEVSSIDSYCSRHSIVCLLISPYVDFLRRYLKNIT